MKKWSPSGATRSESMLALFSFAVFQAIYTWALIMVLIREPFDPGGFAIAAVASLAINVAVSFAGLWFTVWRRRRNS